MKREVRANHSAKEEKVFFYGARRKVTFSCLLGILLIAALTGCEALNPSEETLRMQTEMDLEGEGSDELPILEDAYDKDSVEADVYGAGLLKLP